MSSVSAETGRLVREEIDVLMGGTAGSLHSDETGIFRCGPSGPRYFGEGRKARRVAYDADAAFASSLKDEELHVLHGKRRLRALPAYSAGDIDETFRHPADGSDLLLAWRRPVRRKSAKMGSLDAVTYQAAMADQDALFPARWEDKLSAGLTFCDRPRLVPQIEFDCYTGYARGELRPVLVKGSDGRYAPLTFADFGMDEFGEWLPQPGSWRRCGGCENCRRYRRRSLSDRLALVLADPSVRAAWFVTLTVSDELLLQELLPRGIANHRDTDLSLTRNCFDAWRRALARDGIGLRYQKVLENGEKNGRRHIHFLAVFSGGVPALPDMPDFVEVGSKRVHQRRSHISRRPVRCLFPGWRFGFAEVDAVDLAHPLKALHYLCKYLSKDAELFAGDAGAWPGIVRTASASVHLGCAEAAAEARRVFEFGLPPPLWPVVLRRIGPLVLKLQLSPVLCEAYALEYEALCLAAGLPAPDRGSSARPWIVSALRRARRKERRRVGGETVGDTVRREWSDARSGRLFSGQKAERAYARRLAVDAARGERLFRAARGSLLLSAGLGAPDGVRASVVSPAGGGAWSVVDSDGFSWLCLRSGYACCPVVRWRRAGGVLVLDVTYGANFGPVADRRSASDLLAAAGLPASACRILLDEIFVREDKASALASALAAERERYEAARLERLARSAAAPVWGPYSFLPLIDLPSGLIFAPVPDG